MKEDILEQIAADWLLQKNGCFVKTNLKYKPSPECDQFNCKSDIIHSDIDLLSVDLQHPETVTIINCKSWMDGFDFKWFHNYLSDTEKHSKAFGGKEVWKHFRDLVNEKWHQAFIERIKAENPLFKKLNYIILSVFAKNEEYVAEWMTNQLIIKNFKKSKIEFSIQGKEIAELVNDIETKGSEYAENSAFCRTLQLLRVAKRHKIIQQLF